MDEQANVPVFKASAIYGVIVGLASIVLSLILYFIGQSLEPWAGYLSTIVLVLLIIGSLIMFKREYGKGYAKYGQLVLVSFIVGLVAALLTSAFTFVLYTTDEGYLQDTKYVTLEKVDKQFEKQDLKFQERFSDEQYEAVESRLAEQRKKAIDRVKNQTPMKLAFSGIIAMVFMSVIIGLIAAIFIKRKPETAQP